MVDAPGLLPCPFCGEMPHHMPSGDGTGLMIDCLTKDCVQPLSYGPPATAVASWNRRANMSSPLAGVAMREAAAKVCDERGAHEQRCFGLGREAQNYFRARDAIRALPLPDDAALLRAALAVPEVKRLVFALTRIAEFDGDDADLDEWGAAQICKEALAALKGAAE